MGKPSDIVKIYLTKAIDDASENDKEAEVLRLISNVNQMIDELAELALDQEITFAEKFQAIEDMHYLSKFLENTMATLKREDIIKLISDDPYDRIVDFLKDPSK